MKTASLRAPRTVFSIAHALRLGRSGGYECLEPLGSGLRLFDPLLVWSAIPNPERASGGVRQLGSVPEIGIDLLDHPMRRLGKFALAVGGDLEEGVDAGLHIAQGIDHAKERSADVGLDVGVGRGSGPN